MNVPDPIRKHRLYLLLIINFLISTNITFNIRKNAINAKIDEDDHDDTKSLCGDIPWKYPYNSIFFHHNYIILIRIQILTL